MINTHQKSQTNTCQVCYVQTVYQDNTDPKLKLFECTICKRKCHPYCYNSTIKNNFICDVCSIVKQSQQKVSFNLSNKCILCQNIGLLKQISQNQFIHPICALISSQIKIISFENLQFQFVQQQKSQKMIETFTCQLCQNQIYNENISCQFQECQNKAHLYCIIKNFSTEKLFNNVNQWLINIKFKNEIKVQKKSKISKLKLKDFNQNIYCPNHSNQLIYCYCNKISNLQEWIFCQRCLYWYHIQCLNLKSSQIQQLDENYICKLCQDWSLAKQTNSFTLNNFPNFQFYDYIIMLQKNFEKIIQIPENYTNLIYFRTLKNTQKHSIKAHYQRSTKQDQIYLAKQNLFLQKNEKIEEQVPDTIEYFQFIMFKLEQFNFNLELLNNYQLIKLSFLQLVKEIKQIKKKFKNLNRQIQVPPLFNFINEYHQQFKENEQEDELKQINNLFDLLKQISDILNQKYSSIDKLTFQDYESIYQRAFELPLYLKNLIQPSLKLLKINDKVFKEAEQYTHKENKIKQQLNSVNGVLFEDYKIKVRNQMDISICCTIKNLQNSYEKMNIIKNEIINNIEANLLNESLKKNIIEFLYIQSISIIKISIKQKRKYQNYLLVFQVIDKMYTHLMSMVKSEFTQNQQHSYNKKLKYIQYSINKQMIPKQLYFEIKNLIKKQIKIQIKEIKELFRNIALKFIREQKQDIRTLELQSFESMISIIDYFEINEFERIRLIGQRYNLWKKKYLKPIQKISLKKLLNQINEIDIMIKRCQEGLEQLKKFPLNTHNYRYKFKYLSNLCKITKKVDQQLRQNKKINPNNLKQYLIIMQKLKYPQNKYWDQIQEKCQKMKEYEMFLKKFLNRDKKNNNLFENLIQYNYYKIDKDYLKSIIDSMQKSQFNFRFQLIEIQQQLFSHENKIIQIQQALQQKNLQQLQQIYKFLLLDSNIKYQYITNLRDQIKKMQCIYLPKSKMQFQMLVQWNPESEQVKSMYERTKSSIQSYQLIKTFQKLLKQKKYFEYLSLNQLLTIKSNIFQEDEQYLLKINKWIKQNELANREFRKMFEKSYTIQQLHNLFVKFKEIPIANLQFYHFYNNKIKIYDRIHKIMVQYYQKYSRYKLQTMIDKLNQQSEIQGLRIKLTEYQKNNFTSIEFQELNSSLKLYDQLIQTNLLKFKQQQKYIKFLNKCRLLNKFFNSKTLIQLRLRYFQVFIDLLSTENYSNILIIQNYIFEFGQLIKIFNSKKFVEYWEKIKKIYQHRNIYQSSSNDQVRHEQQQGTNKKRMYCERQYFLLQDSLNPKKKKKTTSNEEQKKIFLIEENLENRL